MKERGLFVRVGVATVEFFRGAPEMLEQQPDAILRGKRPVEPR